MANYSVLDAAIDSAIYTNGTGAITAATHNAVLKSLTTALKTGYLFVGIATPTTNPNNPDELKCYITSEAGTYTNFSGIVVAENTLVFIKGSGTTWTADVVLSDIATLTYVDSSSASITSSVKDTSFGESYVQDIKKTITDAGGTVYPSNAGYEFGALKANDLDYKANLLLLPVGTKVGTGVGDGTLYSVKGDNFNVARTTTKTRVNADRYIEQVPIDVAAIDYSTGDANVNSEPSATNKITYPFDITDVSWTVTNATIDDNTGAYYISPFKEASGNVVNVARKLVATAANPTLALTTGIDLSASTNSGKEVILKPIDEDTYTFNGIALDFSTKTYGTGVTVTELADGWYYVKLLSTATATEQNTLVGTTVSTGDVCYISGMQLEADNVTSFINDPSAAEGLEVTRGAESMTANITVHNHLSWYGDQKRQYSFGSNVDSFSMYYDAFHYIAVHITESSISLYLVDGSTVTQISHSNSSVDRFKFVVRIEGLVIEFYVNGVLVGSEAITQSLIDTLNKFNVSHNGGAKYPTEVRSIILYNNLTSSGAIQLTTP